jgi:hypothetical protein
MRSFETQILIIFYLCLINECFVVVVVVFFFGLLWVANFHLLFLTISELCLFGSSLFCFRFCSTSQHCDLNVAAILDPVTELSMLIHVLTIDLHTPHSQQLMKEDANLEISSLVELVDSKVVVAVAGL